MIARQIFRPSFLLPQTMRCLFRMSPPAPATSPISFVYSRLISRGISYCSVRCTSASNGTVNGGKKKAPVRLAHVKKFLVAANERAQATGIEPIPKITLNRVTVNIARSGDPAGQNVNKVTTKVNMRFSVGNADWLSDRVKKRIMQMEKNRINKDGELVISSRMKPTQKRNMEDALANLQVFMRLMKKFQAIIDAASCVPPLPSEETMKKITELATTGEQKRLDRKKCSRKRWLLEEAV